MHQISAIVQILICTFSCLSTTVSLAQVTPDNTLDTQVRTNGNVSEITGGQTRGGNLFHSFQDFSVQTGTEAFFNNANNVSNIFSRVTGGNISNINGLIRANGSADLFLINPAGIIFGENAQLNIGGSFLSSTADSILFDEGEFSATDVDSPLLTVNMPIGLNLGNNLGAIVNRSTAEDSEANSVGLSVLAGNNLSFVGGNIQFEGGRATAKGGNIQLGSLSQAGIVGISQDGSLTFPENVAKADIALSNAALVDVRSAGAGNIRVNASNLDLTENSELRAGIAPESTTTNAQAGDIEINLADNLSLDNSNITNTVQAEGVGNSGDINITTGSITATNRGQVDTNIFGRGNGGNINITATDDITFDGENDNLESGVISLVLPGAEGDAGNITISTQGNLTLTNGGRVDASTSARGNGGNISLTAEDDITFDGEDLEQLGSGVISLINPDAEGDAGNITISTQGNLTLTNGGRVDASTSARGNGGNINIIATGDINFEGEKNSKGFESGVASQVGESLEGDAGNITISTQGNLTLTNEVRIDTTNNGLGNAGNINISTQKNLNVNDGGQINSNVNGRGNGGNIIINAVGDITFDGDDTNGDGSGVTSLIGRGVRGDAGNITVSTEGKLSLVDGGRIDASSNRGVGNAGSIDITATDNIFFEGEDSRGFGSGATSQVNPGVEGNSGGITILTQGDLTLKDGGRIDTGTNAQGDAGFVNITALGDITFEGKALNGNGSGVTSQVSPQAAGNAGNITISTQGNLILKDGGRIDVSINTLREEGNPAMSNTENSSPTADNANIQLQVAENIFLDSNGLISAKALGNADGGNLNIDTEFIIAVPNSNSDIVASAEQGQGGKIKIEASSLFGIEERPLSNSTNDINASSEFGLSGTVEIDILEADPSRESLKIPVEPVQAEVNQTCEINSTGNQSEFVVTGRGGLPPEPEDNFRLSTLATDENPPESQPSAQQSPTVPPPIVEATGWIRNAQGKIVLVASPSARSYLNSHSNPDNCNL